MLRRMAAAKLSLNSTVKLNSGHEMPLLGFGVSQPAHDRAAGAADVDSDRSTRREAPG